MTAEDSDTRLSLPIICGPTASGKTALAMELAEHFAGEIISADSRQVYRLMNIGTAKPTEAEQERTRHHLIDIVYPDEEFNAASFAQLATAAVEDITCRDRMPLLVGGTGLYIKALTEGLLQAPESDPEVRARLNERGAQIGSVALHRELAAVDPVLSERLHPNDTVRIVRALEVYEQTGRPLSLFQKEHGFRSKPYRTLKLGLSFQREELYARIDSRAEVMFASGLVEEVEALLDQGYDPELKSMRTIGYRQALALLRGEMSYHEAVEDLKLWTRRYAKQQLTWFRGDKSIIWVDSSADFVTIRKLIEQFHDN